MSKRDQSAKKVRLLCRSGRDAAEAVDHIIREPPAMLEAGCAAKIPATIVRAGGRRRRACATATRCRGTTARGAARRTIGRSRRASNMAGCPEDSLPRGSRHPPGANAAGHCGQTSSRPIAHRRSSAGASGTPPTIRGSIAKSRAISRAVILADIITEGVPPPGCVPWPTR